MSYTNSVTVDESFDTAVDKTVDALSNEGFGVLSDIDVGATLREKLDVDFAQYRILGACHPPSAYDGLTAEPELGALLPCNVIVYEDEDGDVIVSAVDPATLIGVAGNDELDDLAADVSERLDRVLDALRA